MFLIFWLVRYVAMRIESSGSRANHIGIGCGKPPGPFETIVIVFLRVDEGPHLVLGHLDLIAS